MQAIETRYNGYRFRSRLEARWAVFFDFMEVAWEYEPEGFTFDGIYYLPDFRITSPQGLVQWYEVKPQAVTSDPKFSAFKKHIAAENGTSPEKRPVYAELLSGDPAHWLFECEIPTYCCPRCGAFRKTAEPVLEDPGPISYYCPACSNEPEKYCIGEQKGFTGSIEVEMVKGFVTFDTYWLAYVNGKMMFGAGRARSSRFEHGESGARK